ncbi:MAG: ribosome silencing factor [Eubacteriales bacterium]
MNISEKMVSLALQGLEDKKAEDITIIDISQVSSMADYFVIASGNNKSQIQTMTDSVSDKLGRAGYYTKFKEGYDNANWILLDYQDIIVHIFDQENRNFYNLERIWSDGKKVDTTNFQYE